MRSFTKHLRSNDVLRHGLLVLTANMALNAGVFAFYAVAGRRLGVATYGSLYAAVSLALFASFPSGILSTVISKIAAELRASDDAAHLRALTVTACKIFSAGMLAYAAAGLLLAGFIGGFMHLSYWEVVLAVSMGGCLGFALALRAIAQGIQDFRGLSLSFVLDGALKGTLGAAVAAPSFGVTGGLFGFFGGSIVSGMFSVWRLWSQLASAERKPLHIDPRRVFSTTIGAAALAASVAILSYVDVLVVRHFFDLHDAGLYAAVSSAGKILFFLVAFAPMVLIPKAADSYRRGRNPIVALRGAIQMVVALSAAGLLAFTLGGSQILRLLVGGGFAEAAPLLPWYGLAMALLAIANVVASYSIALHRFAFGFPLILTAIATITAIFFYHPNLHGVVITLVLGNALAIFVVSLALALQTAWAPGLAGMRESSQRLHSDQREP